MISHNHCFLLFLITHQLSGFIYFFIVFSITIYTILISLPISLMLISLFVYRTFRHLTNKTILRSFDFTSNLHQGYNLQAYSYYINQFTQKNKLNKFRLTHCTHEQSLRVQFRILIRRWTKFVQFISYD